MLSLMFLTLAITLVIGVPVAFSVVLSTIVYVLTSESLPLLIVAQKMISGVSSFSTLALPLFIFSGALMVFGSTPRLMKLAGMLVGRVKGGLGTTALIGATMFGAISGSGVATTASIGGFMIPEMKKKGYKPGYCAALLGAASSLGVLIPPSTTFVVYCQMTGVTVSKMFMAGIIPGIVTCLVLIAYNTLISVKHGYGGIAEEYTIKERLKIFGDALLPLFTPIIILGGVFSGIFTATESAAVSCVYAIVLTLFVYRELDFKGFIKTTQKSAVSTANIMLIMAASAPFGWILTYENVPNKVAMMISSANLSLFMVWSVVIILMLILGTFMASTPIILLTVPILLPIMTTYGVDPIQFGVALTIALGVGAISPPLAVCLFTGCQIAEVKVEDTFPEILHLCGMLTLATIVIVLVPKLSLWLPALVK